MISNSEDLFDMLRNQNDDLRTRIYALECNEESASQTHKDAIKALKQQHREELASMKKEKASMQLRIDELERSQEHGCNSHKDKIDAQRRQHKEELNQVQSKNVQMQHRVDELLLSCADLEDAARLSYEQWDAAWWRLHARYSLLGDEHAALRSRYATLGKENGLLEKRVEQLHAQWDDAFEEHEEVTDKFQRQLVRSAAYAVHLQDRYKKMEEKYEEQAGCLDDERQKASEQSRQRLLLNAKVEELVSRLESLKALVEKATAPLTEQVEALEHDFTTLHRLNEDLKAQNESLKARKAELNLDKFELEKKLGEYQECTAKLRRDNVQHGGKVDLLVERCEKALYKANEAMQGEINALREIKSLRDTVARLQSEKREVEAGMNLSKSGVGERAEVGSTLKWFLQGMEEEKRADHESLVAGLAQADQKIGVDVTDMAVEDTAGVVAEEVEPEDVGIELMGQQSESDANTLFDLSDAETDDWWEV